MDGSSIKKRQYIAGNYKLSDIILAQKFEQFKMVAIHRLMIKNAQKSPWTKIIIVKLINSRKLVCKIHVQTLLLTLHIKFK